MTGYIDKIKEISKRILADGEADMVIGFRKGTMPLSNEPCMITKPEDVETLVWDGSCGINLANYLTGIGDKKAAVIAKGCDSRNLVTHIVENKVKRDNLFVIGVPCEGMIDRRKVVEMCPAEIVEAVEDGDKVTVKGAGFEKTLDKKEVLRKNCAACAHQNPVIHDEMAGEPVQEQTGVDRWEEIREIEEMDSAGRQEFFDNLFAPCIRCYACRNACPLCYCPECFVDESAPQWVGKTENPADVKTFHILRAYHCAGRCTDCGACQQSCPVGINMRLLTKKLEKDCFDLFGWEAGLSPEKRPALDAFAPEDPDDFIK
ncbi:4Fe-4S ferredoxin [Candidatus Desulfarcum epimagneticum]|uniref:4Fe-4S ferredoxin n=1 Tax=uncultured Desulfobacteraceae bacterium TaxID=218296 RepID=A0A484HEI3_9BACT|nr:4Fe-4S ferredoxin [uncultured Desulfobacteraceae bacterium]